MKQKLVNSFKSFFLQGHLHKKVRPLLSPISHFVYLSKFSQWRQANPLPKGGDFSGPVVDFNRRFTLYQYLIEQKGLHGTIEYFEFGVSTGTSLTWWLDNNQNQKSRFYGFDTFEGLPEKWENKEQGAYSTGGKLPYFEDTRCQLLQGMFQDSLPVFIKKHQWQARKIIHLDADLYSSTLYVLTSLAPYLQTGDILIFDEFTSLLHEFRALDDFATAYPFKYQLLAAANHYLEIAIEVI